MATLSREQRKLLENTVVAARDAAERGAAKILTSLGAGNREAPEKLSPKDTVLRNQLRAHGRQLGDKRHPNGSQETTHLKQACAYEHWHRLLFARFLAENDLLVNPEYGVAMSLAELRETARAQNLDWLNLASDYAQRMLLEVFQPDDPVLQVMMPPENRQELEEKLAQLPTETFTADDSLGWVYQFWQRDEKERINKSEVKIGADELPSVTQLFTEDYMVLFLLHNTLGAWWTAKRRAEGKDCRLPDYEWTYLRLNDNGSPEAGNYDAWPKAARLLRVLDPCMGSGHFLAFALPILARMRQEEEGSMLDEAVVGVLTENIFGLELDARCSQIAAFNLALTAWRMVGRPIQLPAMNLACSGLGINASQDSWTALARNRGLASDTMSELYTTFQKAPTLGSLIDPTRVGRPLLIAKFEEVWPLLERALAAEQHNDESRELAIAAKGVLAAARILAAKFTLVVTNVPYLGRGRQADDLQQYCEEFYPDAKADIAACFIDRCLALAKRQGAVALVTKQEPLFLGQYKGQRSRLLEAVTWNFVARLGPRAFETISGDRVTVALLNLTNQLPSEDHQMVGWDVSARKTPVEKANSLRTASGTVIKQRDQLLNPDSRIVLGQTTKGSLLSDYATALAGHLVGDSVRFERCFWEISMITDDWELLQSTVESTQRYGGRSAIIFWQKQQGDMYRLAMSVRNSNHVAQNWLRGKPNWGKKGVIVSQMGDLPVTLYLGQIYDCNCCAIIPNDAAHLEALWSYCSSSEFSQNVRKLDQKMNVAPHTLLKVPFDLGRWTETAKSQSVVVSAADSRDLTQWLFDGHPATANVPLQAAIARLLGYRWPRQTGSTPLGCDLVEPDGLENHADADGIVCLSSLGGKQPAADRLRALLSDAFGAEWSAAKLAELLGADDSLEVWLRDTFFAEHCSLFDGRPFVWHVWDGRKDGFHVLVNYHKLAGPHEEGRNTLEKLIYTSLGDWISRQRADVTSGADGAEGRLAAALHLQSELEKILEGKPPYDIFVRWKPIHEQAIGWQPDPNDGVRINMRPWLMAKLYQASKRDACILRVPPIKLPIGTDRGKEPHCDKTDFPWFAETPDRSNDIHLTLDQKRNARERKKA